MGNRIEDNMMGIMADVRKKKEELERHEARNQWEGKYRHYLEHFFKECGRDVRVFDSFEIAAILAFSISHGFENRTEYSKMQKCIKEFIYAPFTYTVRKITGTDGKCEYVWENKEQMRPLKENDELVSQRATEIIILLEKYVYFSANVTQLNTLIGKFRQFYEKHEKL